MNKHSAVQWTKTFLMVVGLFALFGFIKHDNIFHLADWTVVQWGKEHVYWPITNRFRELMLKPVSLTMILIILALQYFFPAKPRQKILSLGLAQDIVFVLTGAVTNLLVTMAYVSFLRGFYNQHLSFLTITPLWAWPEAMRLILAVLAADFVYWLHHYVRHLVPWFWEFHAIHHSQKELNMFTDDRYHFIEYVIEGTFNVIILSIFTVGTTQIICFEIIRKWYTRLYHSNFKSNYGILRYVFVTPQSHRVHHSIELRHRDKNFGVLLSVWDHLFATQYRGYDEYPDTGITDPGFPHEKTAAGFGLFWTFLVQHIYPVKKIIGSLVSRNKVGQ